MKKWKVSAQVNLCADRVVCVEIKANTERKAKIFALKKLKECGYFEVDIVDCEEVTKNA